MSAQPPADGPVLAFDAASPVASAAVATGGRTLSVRVAGAGASAPTLLALVAEALAAAGVAPRDLAGVVALRGPGSFTGTRVALATALGLRLGGVPRATAVSTLEALALAAPAAAARPLAAVDALRDEWFLQPFARRATGPEPLAAPHLLRPDQPLPAGADALVGYGCDRLLARAGAAVVAIEPPPLAAAVAAAASAGRWEWDETRLTAPLYLRAPAVRQPAP